VAAHLGTRSARQCRERFRNYLSPNLRNSQWTEEEDRLLAEKVIELGAKWAMIVAFFPSRSEINLKNRWTQLINRGGCTIEFEKRRVIRGLENVIGAGRGEVAVAVETRNDAIDWDFADPGESFDFLGPGGNFEGFSEY
jgi:hypothetical protein